MNTNKFKVVKMDDFGGIFTNSVWELFTITEYGDHKLATLYSDLEPTAMQWQGELLSKVNHLEFLAKEIVK